VAVDRQPVVDATVAGRLGVAAGLELEPKQAKHVLRTLSVTNQFGKPRAVLVKKELELCVPSQMRDSGALR
jgi:hypothetical protein